MGGTAADRDTETEVKIHMKKTGLVVEGGGMKCAYSAGVLDAFLENQITFDYCIGASAGAASAASYVAGQQWQKYSDFIRSIRRILCTLVSEDFLKPAICLI